MVDQPEVRRSEVIVHAAAGNPNRTAARALVAANKKVKEELVKWPERLGHVQLDGTGRPVSRDEDDDRERWHFSYEVFTA